MANLLRTLRGGERSITTVDDFAAAVGSFSYNGAMYGNDFGYVGTGGMTQTLAGQPAEPIPADFVGFARNALKSNGVIFACLLVRQLTFSAVRFQYQRFNNGRPSELFGNSSLSLLEQPWPGGTTQDLLARTIQDADLAGNAYWTVRGGRLVRLRPDWTQHLLTPITVLGAPDKEGVRRPAVLGWDLLGYLYTDYGIHSGNEPVFLPPEDVAHFAPIPDPEATYRGMSWLTPIVRELQADHLMTRHKLKFFENGATPNLVVKHPPEATPEQVRAFKQALDAGHAGVDKAYSSLHVGGGADVTLVGANMQQVEFKATQGHGETRIAAAAGVPPIIVGLSEGLEAATYSNYAQARRRYADGTLHPLWGNISGSLQKLYPQLPTGVRLWYDSRDVPFLREDEKDAATIAFTQAQTMAQLVQSGYTPDSVQRAVLSGDFGLLAHSGLFSVQLQAPGSQNPEPGQQAITDGSTTDNTGGAA